MYNTPIDNTSNIPPEPGQDLLIYSQNILLYSTQNEGEGLREAKNYL